MQPFLDTVATRYFNRYDDLSSFTFIFPNKRSGAFFLKYLRDCCLQPAIAPKVKTISEFVEDVTETPVDNNIDLLFKLFEAYRKLVGKTADFEKFRSFGETALNDFNEVDMQMVDAASIFKNVKDLNRIKSNFITPRQKEVMREYFNYPDYDNIMIEEERFWKNFEDFDYSEETGLVTKDGGKKLEAKFIQLWNLLYPLYTEFKKLLVKDGVNTSGGSYRDCALRLEEMDDSDSLFVNRKYVFVGFNALTEAERRIFLELKRRRVKIAEKEEPAADFIWDISNRFFSDKDNPAAKYVLQNSKNEFFPFPDWWETENDSETIGMPEQKIRVIAVPSNSMQIKIIKNEIENLNVGKEKFDNAKVAVVLPDDSYLLPLMNSLPEGDFRINLTMGYSLKLTPVMSFISHLRKLQVKKRMDSKVGAYFMFDDLKRFLLHPFAQLIFDSGKIRKFIAKVGKSRRLVVSYRELCEWNPLCEKVFCLLDDNTSPLQTIAYLRGCLSLVEERLESAAGEDTGSHFDIFFIEKVFDAVAQIENCIKTYSVSMNFVSLFSIIDKLIAGVSAAFEGEPLEGLQIMGLLETRNLDFEYLFMPGLNDKVMPRSGFTRTFIPNTVRKAYCMPPSNFQETLFAYYFYRLLGRSRNAVLTYDSRATDNKRGSVSRYILQLKYLFENSSFQEQEARFHLVASEVKNLEIPKDEKIAKALDEFRVCKGKKCRYFSATSLSKYCACPIQFLYTFIQKQKVEKEPMEAIDAPNQGNIIHEAIMNLYIPDENERKKLLDKPKLIDLDYIENILNDEERIERELKRSINHYHYGLNDEFLDSHEIKGSALLVTPNLKKQLMDILRYDMKLVPFEILGCEFTNVVELEIDKDLKVNMKLVIDRLDKIQDKSGEFIRIVDYKTGSVHLLAQNFDDVFNGEYNAKHILQLFIYGYLLKVLKQKAVDNLETIEDEDLKKLYQKLVELPLDNLKTEIYNVPKLLESQSHLKVPDIKSWKKIEVFDSETEDIFSEGLKNKIKEIFNPQVPFYQTSNSKNCEFCDFRLLCDAKRYAMSENNQENMSQSEVSEDIFG